MERKNIITERPLIQSKYVLRYGRSLKELAKIFGVSLSTVYNWLNNPYKRNWLEQKLQEIDEKNN